MDILDAVQIYQCPGCVVGCEPVVCYEKREENEACYAHCPGTIITYVGKVFLGMPKGFNRIGKQETNISIFNNFYEWKEYNKFNIPVWKYKDKHGNTLVRGFMPRINESFIHIFLCDCMKDIDCIEITKEDLKEMD